jgi:8-oxo-dGTP diphosphatase
VSPNTDEPTQVGQRARRPVIGVAVIIYRDHEVLLGKRRGSHGADTWSMPGGHMEFGETPEACARREVAEEVGVSVGELRPVGFTNDVFEDEDLHYVTLFFETSLVFGVPSAREPHKSYDWRWFDWHHLPEPLFLPIRHLLEAGYAPTDAHKTA